MEYFNTDNSKMVFLRENSVLNQRIIDELEDLFVSIRPESLKQRIHQVYLWLQASDFDSPEMYRGIAEDYILLFHFLDKATEYLETEPQGQADLSAKLTYTSDLRARLEDIRQGVAEAAEEKAEKTNGQFCALLTHTQILLEEARQLVR